jgi:hypothetical protein
VGGVLIGGRRTIVTRFSRSVSRKARKLLLLLILPKLQHMALTDGLQDCLDDIVTEVVGNEASVSGHDIVT